MRKPPSRSPSTRLLSPPPSSHSLPPRPPRRRWSGPWREEMRQWGDCAPSLSASGYRSFEMPQHFHEKDIYGGFLNVAHPGLVLFSLPGSLGGRPVRVDLHWGQAKQGHRQQPGGQLAGLQDAPVLLCGHKQPPQWPSGPLAENRSAKHHSGVGKTEL